MKIYFGLLLLFSSLSHADFLKAPANKKFALIVVLPASEGLTTEQKKLAYEAKGWIQESLPTVLQSFSSMLSSADGKDVFLNSSQQIKEDMIQKLQKVQQHLPVNYMHINAYFVAWPEADLNNASVTTEFGFPVVVVEEKEAKRLMKTYAHMNTSIIETLSANYNNGDRFQFAAAAFKIRLEKETSIFTLQLYGGLNPGVSEFIDKGDEVELSKLVIPPAVRTFHALVPFAPTVLLSIRQTLKTEATPTVDLDFGTFGGIAGEISAANGFSSFGELQIFRDDLSEDGSGDCELKKATPTLAGVLGPKATGLSVVDQIAKGRDVQFRIFQIHFNLLNRKIESMDVRMDLGQLNCLSLKSVKTKFKDKANVAIESKLNSLYTQDDLTDKLMDQLYRNETKN